MNSRNSKLLFMLIDKIDERYIDEAWGGDDKEIYGDIDFSNIDYDSDMRRGVNVVLEHRPFRVFAPVVTAAACMLLFVAGGFAAVNIFKNELLQPNSRAENPASYIESSEPNTSGEPAESNYGSEDYSISQPVSDIDGNGIYEFDFSFPLGKEVHSDAAEKMNNWGYAQIEIKETNATEERPIIALILKSAPKGGLEPISQEMYITGPGAYEIPYTTLRGAGSYSYLYLAYPDMNNEYTDPWATISGTWSP